MLQIWDTAGQERFQSLSSAFYRGADCCAIVYDVTEPQSFERIAHWRDHFLSKSQPDNPAKLPILILGNKVDKVDDRKVTKEMGDKFLAECKDDFNCIFYEVSAKAS